MSISNLNKSLDDLRMNAVRLGFDIVEKESFFSTLKPYAEQMIEFAEVVLLCLNDANPMFEPSLEYGGTGIFGSGFSWRALTNLRRRNQAQECEDVIRAVLKLYPFIEMNVGKCVFTVDHEEDSTIKLEFLDYVPETLEMYDVFMGTLTEGGALVRLLNLYNCWGTLDTGTDDWDF